MSPLHGSWCLKVACLHLQLGLHRPVTGTVLHGVDMLLAPRTDDAVLAHALISWLWDSYLSSAQGLAWGRQLIESRGADAQCVTDAVCLQDHSK